MADRPLVQDGRVVTFIDIGTNSIRLMVARIHRDCSYAVLSRQKETVRLGEGEFTTGLLLEDAMDRAVLVCTRFMRLARSFGRGECVAVATSATREAENRTIFTRRLRHEAGVDVLVISGKEEAGLIYRGVAGGMHLEGKQALFIDIGGGSTEISIGDQNASVFLESLSLGSIRLSNRFFPSGNDAPVTRSEYQSICDHVREVVAPIIGECRQHRMDIAVGSSGTIINLAEIARRARPGRSDDRALSITRDELEAVSADLCSLPLVERKKVPGINPERADIIICGAAIIETLMRELNVDRLCVSDRGLQEGLLLDYLSKMDDFSHINELPVRQRSILQLGRSCGINEFHARNVTRLALELFDSARTIGLHTLGDRDRELLEYATFLHDIGSSISYKNHHAHSAYIIQNAAIPGFDRHEIDMMAHIARFHRKKAPGRKHPSIRALDAGTRDQVIQLSAFLRLAESLDRSHAGLVEHARFTGADQNRVYLEIRASMDCQLEIWGVENEAEHFERVFGRRLILDHSPDETPVPSA